MSKKALVRSGAVISLATGLSRILGFVRDITIACFFGTSPAAQAFVVAFRIPNSLRDLVGEGAINAALVPVLSEYRTLKGESEFVRASKVLFNISLLVLAILTFLGIVFSPFIVRLIAPGFASDQEKFALTVTLNRIIFPYLILIGLTAYAMGVLNTVKHFAAPAFGPCLMNIAFIAVPWLLSPRIGVYGLVVGVLAGGVLQLAVNIPVMRKHGLTIDLKEGLRHPAVKRIGILLIPRALGSAIYQVNIFVSTIIASLGSVVGEGGVAALYYANRLIQFPLAIFGLALAQAALPKMSQEYVMKETGRFKETLSFSLRTVFLIMIPSSAGLAILGKDIIRILFERGEFTAYSSAITTDALFYYAFGLFAYSGTKLLVTSFYSMHDTTTPVKTALLAVIINIILNFVLMRPLKLGGLALATSISASVNFFVLYVLLARRIGDFGTRAIVQSAAKVLAATAIMALCLTVAMKHLGQLGIMTLIMAIVLATIVFFGAGFLFAVQEIRGLFAWTFKRE